MNSIMPPPLGGHLRAQIELLKKHAAENRQSITKSCMGSLVPPMEELISQWIKSLTPTQLSRMYGIDEVIQLAALKGRYKTLPARQMVATALYKCGFDQIRCWKKLSRNKRFWKISQINLKSHP